VNSKADTLDWEMPQTQAFRGKFVLHIVVSSYKFTPEVGWLWRLLDVDYGLSDKNSDSAVSAADRKF
jgi:hypothetical protein